MFFLSCFCYAFVRVCLYVLCGHLLGKGWPLDSRVWCLLWVCHFPIGILGQVWYLIVSILDLCTLQINNYLVALSENLIAYICLFLLLFLNVRKEASSVDPDQVAPKGAVWSECTWFDQNVSKPFQYMTYNIILCCVSSWALLPTGIFK